MLQYKDLTISNYNDLLSESIDTNHRGLLLLNNDNSSQISSFSNAALEYDIVTFEYYFAFTQAPSGSGIFYLPVSPLEGFTNQNYTENFIYFNPYIEDGLHVGFMVESVDSTPCTLTYNYYVQGLDIQKPPQTFLINDYYHNKKVVLFDTTELSTPDFSVVVHVQIRGQWSA